MTNKDKIQKALGTEKIGCYNILIDNLNAANLTIVKDTLLRFREMVWMRLTSIS